ncbi:MAG: hypothetical protein AAF618_03085 [Pseudomonadota bacterium]
MRPFSGSASVLPRVKRSVTNVSGANSTSPPEPIIFQQAEMAPASGQAAMRACTL